MPPPLTRPTFADLDGLSPNAMDATAPGGGEAHHWQVGAGRLTGEFGTASLVKTVMKWWQVTADLRVVGTAPPGHHSMLLAIDAAGRTKLNGHPLEAGNLVLYAPATPLDGVMAAGCRLAALALPADLLVAAILGPAELTLPEPTDGIVVLRPERWASDELTRVLTEIRDLARTEPELFDDDPWRANVERGALEAFAEAVTSGCQVPTASPQSRGRSAEIVTKVDDWLSEARSGGQWQKPTVADLCRAAGVRRRMLERAFHDILGVSPAEYVRARSLNGVRQALLSDTGALTITVAAVNHGFWHLGRFAGQYRELFGETPSETLRRRAPIRAWPAPPPGAGLAG